MTFSLSTDFAITYYLEAVNFNSSCVLVLFLFQLLSFVSFLIFFFFFLFFQLPKTEMQQKVFSSFVGGLQIAVL